MLKPLDKSTHSALWQALGLAWELGYTIAVPLVGLALLGRFADKWLGTNPWLFLTGVILSIAISSILVVKKTQSIMNAALAEDKIQKENKEDINSTSK
jgi:F0F1-type ATP synthase assembly protein I